MTESINRPYEPRLKIIVCLTLIVIVFSVFLQVKSFNFVYYDDDQYILTNLHVRGGFSISNLEWALTSNEYSNWFPLTWVSHMADVWLYGLWPGGHHLTNVCLHAVNTVLLFLFFSSVTGTIWRSALIAALFAAHPMRVESVAWVAERKDVLSAFFWISAMCAYVYYTKRPSLGRYMSVILCFILGLMSKPVIITLPLALLLADYWPLGRFTSRAGAASLLMEKVPFLILSAISGVITFSVQQAGGSVAPLSSLTLALRLENVAISYVKYVIKLFYPAGLALMYRHPVSYPAWQIVGAVTVLLAVSIFALAHMRRRPWFFTGWFWYILTLLPTIGLVKVGISYMADRYTYMPFVGLFIILAMSLPERSKLTYAAASSATALIIICVTLTNNQLKYWRNGVTLFSRAAAVTKDSYFAYYSLGYTLNKEGRYAEAEMAFNEAAKIKPYYAEALLYLGLTRLKQDKLNESLEVFKEAIQARPSMAEAYNGAGVALMSLGRLDEAAAYFKRALAADSGDEAAILNLKLITSNKHMED